MKRIFSNGLKKFSPKGGLRPASILLYGTAFALIGVATLLVTRAATPGIPVTVDETLPNPTNVTAWADDRVATIMWDPVQNASSRGIIGYYISWGTGSTYTNAKQTEFSITQIQPLTNGMLYNVKVQSVHGNFVNAPNPAGHEHTPREGRASGRVSTGLNTTVTPSSARVDFLRSKMTAFFDDFNKGPGGMDELKWNNASACGMLGYNGAFVNNQFHAHNQLKSGYGNTAWCGDRGQMASRPRGVFDTSVGINGGPASEANPAVIAFDFDGVPYGRDTWYLDLIPFSERRNGIPLDVGTHQGSNDDLADPSSRTEPKMIRMAQGGVEDRGHGILHMMYYGDDQRAYPLVSTGGCTDEFRGHRRMENCWNSPQDTSLSPLPEPNIFAGEAKIVKPNVRHHWIMQVSPTKIKIFINNVLMWEGPMPAEYRNVTKYYLHSTLFSYNTGKSQYASNESTFLHWDNFGFTGPAPTIKTHNYQDGGPTGNQPYLGFGTIANPISRAAPRSTRINIPDPIGSPTQARLMYSLGNGVYTWKNTDTVTINGRTYPVPNPADEVVGPLPRYTGNSIVPTSAAFGVSLIVNAADLRQGMNDISFNFRSDWDSSSLDINNIHIEMDYPINSSQPYTQPEQIFGKAKYDAAIMPTMSSHDSYLYVESDFGLPSGALDSGTPNPDPPTGGDTTRPTVSLTAPANNASFVAGAAITASANASDNIGVARVEFYIGNTLKATDTSSPFTGSLSTTGMTANTYTLSAVAYDAAGNSMSDSRTITITAAPKVGDINGDGSVNAVDLSILLSRYNQTVTANQNGDLNGDGRVTAVDLSLLLANYGR